MPRAEVGSTKYVANKMKSKGLQRLRWYCQACEKQCRDENGFKCHVASESHVRKMQAIGEDPRKAISDFSNQFKRDFLQLLRTGHGEKVINLNHFYQEYIAHKEHVHMNATKWTSLSEFAKYLGREGICRVEVDEKNEERGGASSLTIGWIDDSPEALRRQEAIRKKERQDRGDEDLEQRLIREQIRRAKRDGVGVQDDEEAKPDDDDEHVSDSPEGFKRPNGEKVVLNFAAKKTSEPEKPPTPPLSDQGHSPEKDQDPVETTEKVPKSTSHEDTASPKADAEDESKPKTTLAPISFNTAKPKNIFAAAPKKNAFSAGKKPAAPSAQRPMSAAERIMREEMERKRQREERSAGGAKRQRVS